MMRQTLLFSACVAAVISLAGCADTMSGGGMSSMAQSGMAMSSMDYVGAAAESDQFEIQEGQLAASRSNNPRVRDMGQMLVRDHMMTTRTLMAAAARSGMPPMAPPSLRPDHQQMFGQLQSASGPDFDRMFAAQQVPAHQEALSLHSSYASAGNDPNLRGAARGAVPIVRQHLDMARQMDSMAGR